MGWQEDKRAEESVCTCLWQDPGGAMGWECLVMLQNEKQKTDQSFINHILKIKIKKWPLHDVFLSVSYDYLFASGEDSSANLLSANSRAVFLHFR